MLLLDIVAAGGLCAVAPGDSVLVYLIVDRSAVVFDYIATAVCAP